MFDPTTPITSDAADTGDSTFLSPAAASPDYATLCRRADRFIATYDLCDQVVMMVDLQRYLAVWEVEERRDALFIWLNADPQYRRVAITEGWK